MTGEVLGARIAASFFRSQARPPSLKLAMARPIVALVEKRQRQVEIARGGLLLAYAGFLEDQAAALNAEAAAL